MSPEEVLPNALLAIAVPMLVLLVLGMVFGAIGVWRSRRTKGWVVVPGVLTDRDGGIDGSLQRFPTFRWQGPDGRWHQATSSVRGGIYRSGTPTTVRVNPADPRQAQLEGPIQGGLLFVIVGAVLGAGGMLLLVAALVLR